MPAEISSASPEIFAEINRLKAEKLQALEREDKFREELPHIYGWPWYSWAREFFETRNKEAFLCAGNQLSKSSTQIRKVIEWATNQEMWPFLWRTRPRQFWYLYPTKEVATIEVQKKWIPEFMPRGSLAKSQKYGWKIEKDGRNIAAIHFNSGVSIYFKAYSQDESHLQSATVHYIALDEEIPENLYEELNFRRNATDGYLSMAFTATIGQQLWYDTIEEIGTDREKFKGAWKKVVSVFDCQRYEDGSPSFWTDDRIRRSIASCKSEAEIQKRVYGRFVKDEGLKYASFVRKHNVCDPHVIPGYWHYYAGVDIGAGGDKNHPSSIAIVAVNPNFKEARVIDGWQGRDKITTMGDVLEKFRDMVGNRVFAGLYYDYHAKDFGTLSLRAGIPFQPAEKSHEIGSSILNVLFKNGMLKIFDLPQLQDLIRELTSVPLLGDKRKLKDDFADSLRYAVSKISFNWEDLGINMGNENIPHKKNHELDERTKSYIEIKKKMVSPQNNETISIEDELKAWNELYDY